MPGGIIIVDYDTLKKELKQEKEKTNYWKNEYDMLKIQYEKLAKENKSLKTIIAKVNRGTNEK